MGDRVLMEFKSTSDAVRAVQTLSASYTAALGPLDLPESHIRSGLHFGLVATRRDGDVFGDAVNVASRLEGLAEPGWIVLSQTAADQLDGEIELRDLGERALKNVEEAVRCWTVPAGPRTGST
jgi:adenylate cyclase